jgi:uncharacterized membrane protein
MPREAESAESATLVHGPTPRPSPVLAAALTTLVCLTLVAAGIWLTGRWRGLFLVWNLFLAWLPLGFAVLAARPESPRWTRWFWSGLWLIFLPNSPYIFTDLIHVEPRHDTQYWIQLGLVLLFALNGLIVGFLSLHRMQGLVNRHFGPWVGWGLVVLTSGLGAIGVAIGRFLRRNSWDILVQPVELLWNIGRWAMHLPGDRHTALFILLFSLFLFFGYVMFHAMEGSGEASTRCDR